MAPKLIVLLGVGLLGSCSESPKEHELYLQAVQGEASIEERLELCAQMSEARARGDCGSMVVQFALEEKIEEPEAICEMVAEGRWRFECFFQVAEYWRRHQNNKRAIAACAKSGEFFNDCGQHLWQQDLQKLVKRYQRKRDDSESLREALLLEAERMHAKWSVFFRGHKEEESDFEPRFWRVFFRQLFLPLPSFDLGRCEEWPVRAVQDCRRSALHLYLTRLNRYWRVRSRQASFCALGSDGVEAMITGDFDPVLRSAPSPEVLGLLAHGYTHLCVEKRALPVERPAGQSAGAPVE